jgi:hypothetical protein
VPKDEQVLISGVGGPEHSGCPVIHNVTVQIADPVQDPVVVLVER